MLLGSGAVKHVVVGVTAAGAASGGYSLVLGSSVLYPLVVVSSGTVRRLSIAGHARTVSSALRPVEPGAGAEQDSELLAALSAAVPQRATEATILRISRALALGVAGQHSNNLIGPGSPPENSRTEIRRSSSSLVTESVRDGLLSRGDCWWSSDEEQDDECEAPQPRSRLLAGLGSRQSRLLRDFCDAEVVGHGGGGVVFRCFNMVDQKTYAIKAIAMRTSVDEAPEAEIAQEARIMAELDMHPNVVRYHASWVESLEDGSALAGSQIGAEVKAAQAPLEDEVICSSSDEDEGDDEADDEEGSHAALLMASASRSSSLYDTIFRHKSSGNGALQKQPTASSPSPSPSPSPSSPATRSVLLIQTEYCDGGLSLDSFIRDPGRKVDGPTLHTALGLFKQLVAGVKHLHAMSVVHCDIKPANVLLHGQGVHKTVKLADFGLSAHESDVRHESSGTVTYMSPEAAETQIRLSCASDIFSLGIILAELLLPPFTTSMERIHTLARLRRDPAEEAHKLLSATPEHAAAYNTLSPLLAAMLHADPAKRPTAAIVRSLLDSLPTSPGCSSRE